MSERPALREQERQEPKAGWKGLHPLSLLINMLPQLVFTLRGVWPLLLVIFITESSSGLEVLDLGLVLAVFALASIRTLTHFLTFRYRVRDGTLEIKMGLVFRYTRSVEARRIQNMEVVQNPLHKLFGLVELRIETAGDAWVLHKLWQKTVEKVPTGFDYKKPEHIRIIVSAALNNVY